MKCNASNARKQNLINEAGSLLYQLGYFYFELPTEVPLRLVMKSIFLFKDAVSQWADYDGNIYRLRITKKDEIIIFTRLTDVVVAVLFVVLSFDRVLPGPSYRFTS